MTERHYTEFLEMLSSPELEISKRAAPDFFILLNKVALSGLKPYLDHEDLFDRFGKASQHYYRPHPPPPPLYDIYCANAVLYDALEAATLACRWLFIHAGVVFDPPTGQPTKNNARNDFLTAHDALREAIRDTRKCWVMTARQLQSQIRAEQQLPLPSSLDWILHAVEVTVFPWLRDSRRYTLCASFPKISDTATRHLDELNEVYEVLAEVVREVGVAAAGDSGNVFSYAMAQHITQTPRVLVPLVHLFRECRVILTRPSGEPHGWPGTSRQ
ncbi:hypothetical protein B0H16DRAFT_1843627 [Mycena metata]|uniref:Uncharacterized protein n=1 Tax=Mycena metata TaxID=1033252 RepID=A0AAD7ITM7_9AGAR|nr:hypothetical protein B0H16DRAFT_1843627 [Mycena metata]